MEMTMKTGSCEYCHDTKMVEAPEGASQETVDKIVTAQCICKKALAEREKVQQRTAVAYQIEQIIEPKSSAAAEIVRDAIEAMQLGNIKKITIATPDKWTISMTRSTNGIKISAQTTYAEEEEVY